MQVFLFDIIRHLAVPITQVQIFLGLSKNCGFEIFKNTPLIRILSNKRGVLHSHILSLFSSVIWFKLPQPYELRLFCLQDVQELLRIFQTSS